MSDSRIVLSGIRPRRRIADQLKLILVEEEEDKLGRGVLIFASLNTWLQQLNNVAGDDDKRQGDFGGSVVCFVCTFEAQTEISILRLSAKPGTNICLYSAAEFNVSIIGIWYKKHTLDSLGSC